MQANIRKLDSCLVVVGPSHDADIVVEEQVISIMINGTWKISTARMAIPSTINPSQIDEVELPVPEESSESGLVAWEPDSPLRFLE